MKDFFKGVRKHIGKLDAEHLREQYELVTDEFAATELILHSLHEGIILVNEDGEVIRANPAAKALIGMSPDATLADLQLPYGRAAKREIAITYPEARTLEAQTIPLGGDTLVILRDISSEKARTEEELRAGATQAVRDLASGVAHEIGNPLNALALNLQLLERDPGDRDAIKICRDQVKRLDGILKGFLQALKPSRPNLRRGSAAAPVNACLTELKAQFEERRISVTLDIPSTLPPVAIDEVQMQQVYFNLLKNALEAMHDGGAIAITVGSDDESVVVAFKDDGEGMTTDQLTHLFEPYRTSKEHGTGLGLMISSRIVRDHGGTIDVESAPGTGTTFTIRLPRLERRIRALK